jgi:prepilin-type N-terminal cleavage/methylation domain-containing protein
MRSMSTNLRGSPAKWSAGFTLIEMLLSMSLSVVLLSSLFILYYGAAHGAAKDENTVIADRESRMVTDRLSHDFKLVGLMALPDVNGDANDIKRDVPGQPWSDSLRQDFEYANTYEVVFTADYDDDDHTETVRYYRDADAKTLKQEVWKWSRDSLRWTQPVIRNVAHNVDFFDIVYYDKDGTTIPNPQTYPAGGYTLSNGDRLRVTAMQVTVVTRASHTENAHNEYLAMPDGTHFNDKYPRVVSRFMVRGRNLSIGA